MGSTAGRPVTWNGPRPVPIDAPDQRPGTRPVDRNTDRRADWCRVANQADSDEAEVWIYGEIGYWGTTAGDFVDQLKGVTASTITLHLNSPGGDVFDGIAIYNCLLGHPATVNVRIEALAASAASFIAMAGDKITIARNAQMMIHDAHGLTVGNADDMRTMADLLDKCSDNIAGIYNDRAGGGVASWRKAMKAETWYSADEAKTAGLADEVAPLPKRDEDDAQARLAGWDLSVFQHAGRADAPAPVIPGARPANEAPPPDPAPPAPPEPTDTPAPEPAADDAVALGDLDYDPDAMRAGLALAAADTFDLDPELFRAAMELAAAEAPAIAEPAPPTPAPPGHISLDQFTNALMEALA